MEKISSRKVFFLKKIFPVLWFGVLGIVAVSLLAASATTKQIPMIVMIVPLGMMLFGFVLMRLLVFDLMDEVYDAGDHLTVRKGNEEDLIPLANIINLSQSFAVNPPRLTLTLRKPCRFGQKIAFCPIVSWGDLKSLGFNNAIADDLIPRIDAARRGAQ